MTDKVPFSFLIRPEERAILRRLAEIGERSEGATLRWLIRSAALEQHLQVQSAHVITSNDRAAGPIKGGET